MTPDEKRTKWRELCGQAGLRTCQQLVESLRPLAGPADDPHLWLFESVGSTKRPRPGTRPGEAVFRQCPSARLVLQLSVE